MNITAWESAQHPSICIPIGRRILTIRSDDEPGRRETPVMDWIEEVTGVDVHICFGMVAWSLMSIGFVYYLAWLLGLWSPVHGNIWKESWLSIVNIDLHKWRAASNSSTMILNIPDHILLITRATTTRTFTLTESTSKVKKYVPEYRIAATEKSHKIEFEKWEVNAWQEAGYTPVQIDIAGEVITITTDQWRPPPPRVIAHLEPQKPLPPTVLTTRSTPKPAQNPWDSDIAEVIIWLFLLGGGSVARGLVFFPL